MIPFSLTKWCVTSQRAEMQNAPCLVLVGLEQKDCAGAMSPPLWKGGGTKEGEAETAADPSGSKLVLLIPHSLKEQHRPELKGRLMNTLVLQHHRYIQYYVYFDYLSPSLWVFLVWCNSFLPRELPFELLPHI